MSTPLQIITLRAPAFALEANITGLISEATKEVGSEYCSDLKNKAIALLTMHWIALSKKDATGNTTGSITSEKEGQLSRTYGGMSNSSGIDPYLALTSWGIELYNLQRKCFVLPRNRFV